MPLNSRNIPQLPPRPHVKSSRELPSNAKNNLLVNIDNRTSKVTSTNNCETDVKTTDRPLKRKNLHPVRSCQGLLKKAREIYINDPRQTYLPLSKGKIMISRSPNYKFRRFSDDAYELITMEYPRTLNHRN